MLQIKLNHTTINVTIITVCCSYRKTPEEQEEMRKFYIEKAKQKKAELLQKKLEKKKLEEESTRWLNIAYIDGIPRHVHRQGTTALAVQPACVTHEQWLCWMYVCLWVRWLGCPIVSRSWTKEIGSPVYINIY